LRGLVLLSIIAGGLFLVRGVSQAIYWADPAHHEQPLEGWMTLGYVARSFDVDKAALAESLGLDATAHRRRTLESLASDRGQSVEAFADAVRDALQRVSAP
jgi:hypothetical protein